jgi:hypothetical protein
VHDRTNTAPLARMGPDADAPPESPPPRLGAALTLPPPVWPPHADIKTGTATRIIATRGHFHIIIPHPRLSGSLEHNQRATPCGLDYSPVERMARGQTQATDN